MKRLALLLIAVLWLILLGTIGYYQHLKSEERVPEFVKRPYFESSSCRQCHQEIYDEWKASPHAKALSSTFPRLMDPTDKQAACLPCHTPQPVLETGLDQPPLTRDQRREEGVSCTTCHQTADGMAAAHTGTRGSCNPIYDARISQPKMCESCHNAHGTVDQWRASRYAQDGTDCLDCHMPKKDGHRQHFMPGAHDHDSLRSATRLAAEQSGAELVVKVGNQGAGHNLPSGRRSRSMVLVVQFATPQGDWVADQRYLFRNPFKGEPGENTQLACGETRGFRYKIPATAVKARAQLLYQFKPSQPDASGVVLQKAELELHDSGLLR